MVFLISAADTAQDFDGFFDRRLFHDELGMVRGVGMDIVNHCINDILVQGARPLFFLDYVASSKIVPEQVARVVEGTEVPVANQQSSSTASVAVACTLACVMKSPS